MTIDLSKSPTSIALETCSRKISYDQLNQLIDLRASELTSLGVQPGHKVAFLADTSEDVVVLIFSLNKLGAIACLINPKEKELLIPSILEDFHADFFIDHKSLALIQQFSRSLLSFDLEVGILMRTSGSSGPAKVVALGWDQLFFSAESTLSLLKISSSTRYLLSLPLYHVSGLGALIRTLMAGGCLIVHKYESIQTLLTYRITHVSFVPTQLYRLLKDSSPTQLSLLSLNLKCMLLGGAPASLELIYLAKSHYLPIYTSYGMTETAALMTLDTELSDIEHGVSSGRPLPKREIKISDSQEILVKGPSLFKGYLSSEGTLSIPLDKEGFFHTKDLGCFSTNGNLFILGRKDNQFISGGENIQPEEIESFLRSYEEIEEAFIVPIKDKEYGMRPVAFVKTSATLKEIDLYLKERLPSYKIPKRIYLLGTPKDSLKWSRKELMTLAESLEASASQV